MTKLAYAAKANFADTATKGVKTMTNKGTSADYTIRPNAFDAQVEHIVSNKTGQLVASLCAGTGGRYQLLSADCLQFVNFTNKPSLDACLSALSL